MDRTKIRKILELSDINTQRVKWFEELGELIRALAKGDIDNIAEETADVLIIISQIMEHYHIEEIDIDAITRAKIQRTINRLEYADKLPNIRPCGKCGAPGILVTLPGSCDNMYRIDCKCCGRMSSIHNTKEATIEAWNKMR